MVKGGDSVIEPAHPNGRRKRPINIRIDAELHDRMKHYCIDKNKTITAVVTEAFEEILKKDGEKRSDGTEDGVD